MFENTKCLPTFSLRRRVSPSLLAPSAGWTNSLRRSLHLHWCCRKQFRFTKSANRSLQSPPDLLARAPAPSCKHPFVSAHPWRRRKSQAQPPKKKHRHKTTERHNPFRVSSEPIRRRHRRQGSCSHSQAKAIGRFRNGEKDAARIRFWDDSSLVTLHFSRGSDCSALAKA